jgi:hypothetical protein
MCSFGSGGDAVKGTSSLSEEWNTEEAGKPFLNYNKKSFTFIFYVVKVTGE